MRILHLTFAVALMALLSTNAFALAPGDEAPAWDLPLVGQGEDAGNLSLADLEGKFVVLDFWATWCGPCRNAMASTLNPFWNENGDNDAWTLVSIGNAWRNDTVEAQERFIAQQGYGWTFVHDADNAVTTAYGVTGIPTIVLIAPDGRVMKSGHTEVFELVREVMDPEARAEMMEDLDAWLEQARAAELEAQRQRMEAARTRVLAGSTDVVPGETYEANLAPRVQLVYRFQVEEACTVTISTSGDIDPMLILANWDLETLGTHDDNSEGDLNATITAELEPGWYIVAIRLAGGNAGTCTLSFEGEGLSEVGEEMPVPQADETPEQPEEEEDLSDND